MQLSYYCYDTALCTFFSEQVHKRFGPINLSINRAVLDNTHFTEIYSAETADFILFPFDIGLLIELMGVTETENMLAQLALYTQYQPKHVLFDYGDRTASIHTKAILFKVSMRFPYENTVYPLWYITPQHVTTDTYVLDFKHNKYDICFVGTNSNPLRKAACASLMRTNTLRSYIDIIDGVFENNVFYSPQIDTKHMLERQDMFRKCIKVSKLSFCPPGVGPHSVRFFESLYYGRIPVVLYDSDTVLPFHDTIDYSQFSLTIPLSEVLHTGEIVDTFLRTTSDAELYAMSVQACKIYHTFFSNENIPRYIHRSIFSCLHMCK